MNFGGFVELHARSDPDRLAIVDGRCRLSYGQLDELASRFANTMANHGMGAGDRVAFYMLNRAELVIGLVGCFKAGIVAVPLNWRLKGPDLAAIVRHAEPGCVVTVEACRDDFDVPLCLWGGDQSRAGSFWDALEDASPEFASLGRQAHEVANLIYTSGTTSVPKAVIHTHGMRIAIAGAMTKSFELSRKDVALAVSPIFHTSGMSVLSNALFVGCPCILLEKWDVSEFVRLVSEEGVTFMHLIATLVVDIANAPEELFSGLSSRLRMVWGGGHNINGRLLKKFEDRLGTTLVLGYSRTEGGLTYNRIGRDERSFDHNGFPNADSSHVAIYDPERDRMCEIGEIGEIVVRGDGVTPGYWDGPYTRVPTSYGGGWQPTGDLGFLDEFGALHFRGRGDDMIKTGGENVYPSEVANVLLDIDGVSDVAVFGIPDDRLGQKIAALVVRTDQGLSESDIEQAARSMLGNFKIPRKVRFVPELPRLGTQKVDFARCRTLLLSDQQPI